jgi:hypothetical protein
MSDLVRVSSGAARRNGIAVEGACSRNREEPKGPSPEAGANCTV